MCFKQNPWQFKRNTDSFPATRQREPLKISRAIKEEQRSG